MPKVQLASCLYSEGERIIDSFDQSILKWPPVEVSTPEGLDDETQSDDSTMRTGADLRPLSPLSDTSTSCLSSSTSSTDCTGEPGKKRKIQTSLSFIPKAKRIDVIALLSTKGIKLYTDDQIRKAQRHLKKRYQFVNMYYRQLMEDVKCRQLNKTELKGMVEVAWTLHCSEQSVIDSKKATALLERVKDKASADQLNMITVQKNVDRVEKAKFSITQCQKKIRDLRVDQVRRPLKDRSREFKTKLSDLEALQSSNFAELNKARDALRKATELKMVQIRKLMEENEGEQDENDTNVIQELSDGEMDEFVNEIKGTTFQIDAEDVEQCLKNTDEGEMKGKSAKKVSGSNIKGKQTKANVKDLEESSKRDYDSDDDDDMPLKAFLKFKK